MTKRADLPSLSQRVLADPAAVPGRRSAVDGVAEPGDVADRESRPRVAYPWLSLLSPASAGTWSGRIGPSKPVSTASSPIAWIWSYSQEICSSRPAVPSRTASIGAVSSITASSSPYSPVGRLQPGQRRAVPGPVAPRRGLERRRPVLLPGFRPPPQLLAAVEQGDDVSCSTRPCPARTVR